MSDCKNECTYLDKTLGRANYRCKLYGTSALDLCYGCSEKKEEAPTTIDRLTKEKERLSERLKEAKHGYDVAVSTQGAMIEERGRRIKELEVERDLFKRRSGEYYKKLERTVCFDECQAEPHITKLEAVADLVRRYARHVHISIPNSDTCALCTEDVRDGIHLRTGEPDEHITTEEFTKALAEVEKERDEAKNQLKALGEDLVSRLVEKDDQLATAMNVVDAVRIYLMQTDDVQVLIDALAAIEPDDDMDKVREPKCGNKLCQGGKIFLANDAIIDPCPDCKDKP